MTQETGYDIDGLDELDTSNLTHTVAVILDENGEDKSGFYIVGKNSPEYQAEIAKIRVEGVKRSSKRQSALDGSTDEGAETITKVMASNETRLALAVVTGWFGFTSQGQPAQFDKSKVVKMFTKFPTWREKVSAALEVDANFIKG